jgi:imidazolonepropionase-like amidohydrolase
MKNKLIAALAMLLLVGTLRAQVASANKGVFLLTNATIETITKGVVKGSILIQDGKIAGLGANLIAPANAKVIDCSGLTLYPGLIDAGTKIGIGEISAVSVSNDFDEVGELAPQMQALTAVNPSSPAIAVTRVGGVTTALTVPGGSGRFPGTAALINLVGYTPDQMYTGFKGIVLEFPTSAGGNRFFDQRSDEDRKKDEEKAQKRLTDIWAQALLYSKIDSASAGNPSTKPQFNPEMAALMPVVRGQMTLLVEVDKAEDIESAIKWVQARKIKKVIFTGVSEGWRVADKLAKANIPVITGPVIDLPTRTSDRYDRPYANPGLMKKAGVKVAIRSNSTENARNLPFHAGFAAAYGMGREEALRAITIVPAELLGVADHLGSLEVGKSATLFASSGDPMEPRSQIVHVFIDGWQIPLDSRHIQLYQEFLKRSPGVDK